MPLTKSTGNMYPWVTHTHSHLRGECPHKCRYCYVQAMERRWKKGLYTGPLRFKEEELKVNYGSGKTIFVEHCNDLFADGVLNEWILSILWHCRLFPENTYVFQTKNPDRVDEFYRFLPKNCMVGVTIETNRIDLAESVSAAPSPAFRVCALRDLKRRYGLCVFVTIEPVMDFDLDTMHGFMLLSNPDFINIGADSKGSGLSEPSAEKVGDLLYLLDESGIEVREKHNLGRIIGKV